MSFPTVVPTAYHSTATNPAPVSSLGSGRGFTPELRKSKLENHDNSDLSLFAGQYVDRGGILKKLGDTGYNFGAEVAVFSPFINGYSKEQPKNQHGWFLLWTFDHFVDTNEGVLSPEFRDESYTNYMLGGGYAYRRILDRYWQLHYRGGLAVNFLEIDSFRSNNDPNDQKYTDITISTIHKLGFDYLIKRVKEDRLYRDSQIRIGPSVFYYWTPDPLGKFKLKEDGKGEGPGGSTAVMLEVKFEIY